MRAQPPEPVESIYSYILIAKLIYKFENNLNAKLTRKLCFECLIGRDFDAEYPKLPPIQIQLIRTVLTATIPQKL